MSNDNEKYNNLTNNSSFCLAPWMHIHALPSGDILPCCTWDYAQYKNGREKFGNINKSESVTEMLNNPAFKQLRKDFLNGKLADGCQRCYDKERSSTDLNTPTSMRHWMNNFFRNEKIEKSVLETLDDGAISDPNIQYLDIRFGNICNLKCRMCGHDLSSTWYEETVEVNKIKNFNAPTEKFIHADCYDKIEPILGTVKEIYFAGGEPFLYPEHLKILDKLVEIGNTECSIKYNTNLTTLKYKGRSLTDVWKQFPYVFIGASIDDMNDTVEYIRTNLNWKEFEKNFNIIKQEAPHVAISPSPTVGILNIETFVDFEKFCIENDWYIEGTAGSLNYVMWPNHLNVYYLPIWYKEKLVKIYEDHLLWLDNRTVDKKSNNYTRIKELIIRLSMNDYSEEIIDEHMKTLKQTLDMHDITGNLNWKKSLPHIDKMLNEHNMRMHNR